MAHYFDTLSEAEARAFFDTYLSHRERRLEWLRSEYASTGRDVSRDLDYAPDSLLRIWRWSIDTLSLRAHVYYPDWLTDYVKYEVRSVDDWIPKDQQGLLLDSIAFYFADVCIRNLSGVQWEICRLHSIDFNQPVLGGFRYKPHQSRRIVAAVAMEVIDRRSGEDGLLNAYELLAGQLGPLVE
jgi:hypothetical protein